jgi:peptidoglycan/LPS O-acetylase OafA/YrhL
MTAWAEQGQRVGRRIMAEHQTTKFAFIDALRGYAVLLVITCHTGGMFPELPYPLKKLTNFGWHGVQLFFLLSCVTLLLSWRSDEAKNRASVTDFWTRRLFRIAPMYYLAALLYFLVETPPSGFDLGQLLISFTFINAWHPTFIPTVPDRWMVVPGGWSIGVEVTFYFMFPLMALLVRSMRGAIVFCGIALAVGCIANSIMNSALHGNYSAPAIGNFLYFWFPNQLPVFALGTVLYFIVQWLRAKPEQAIAILLRRYGTLIIPACFAAGVAAANLPFPAYLPFAFPLVVPALLVASLIFMIVVAVLGNDPRSPFINRLICSLGQVSFSAYLLHFAVLHKLPQLLPSVFDVGATGWRAVFVWFLLWLVVVPMTHALSMITFRTVENPMIDVGRRLLALRLGRSASPRTRQHPSVKASRPRYAARTEQL